MSTVSGGPTQNGLARSFEVLVVGSGVAGCSAALKLAARGVRVGLITKASLADSTTQWAQGGIAAVLDEGDDSTELHLADTIRAGAGLCDEEATAMLVAEGAPAVLELAKIGAVFDRSPGGELARSLEGGHSRARVIHAGGAATGAEVARSLLAALGASPVELLEDSFALDLLSAGGRCSGVLLREPTGGIVSVLAPVVVLATGGAGQLFAVTTNPGESTGDGVAMALRAGVAVADLEFVQFHPTALSVARLPRPLLSEALRGHGALLRSASGARFVDELARRDVVSRAIAEQMALDQADHVFLDATGLEDFNGRFGALSAMLADAGLDAEHDLLPVAPAAHYACGGVLTDCDGATSLPGLYAVGEVACSGVHGANRLASNSLLEGLVFGSRAAEAILSGARGPNASGALGPLLDARRSHAIALRPIEPPIRTNGAPSASTGSVEARRGALQRAMSEHAGVVRSARGLDALEAELARLGGGATSGDTANAELANLLLLASALFASARRRAESRGAHFRSDYPSRDDEDFACRFVHLGPLRPNASAPAKEAT